MSKSIKKKTAKGIISTILIVSAIMVYLTGVILFFLKTGMFLCFSRKFINDIHVISAIGMAAAILPHFYLNRKIYKNEVQLLLHKPDSTEKEKETRVKNVE